MDGNDNIQARPGVWSLLFNPFQRVAGKEALSAGLTVIVVSAVLGWQTRTHFDGVLDVHTGSAAPLWFFVVEGLLNWAALSAILLLLGKAVSKTDFRAVDLFGTQALARAPFLVPALLALVPSYQSGAKAMTAALKEGGNLQGIPPGDIMVVAAFGLLMVVFIIFSVALMYRAFAVSCNLRGVKAVAAFIGGLILAEVLTKVLIILLYKGVMPATG